MLEFPSILQHNQYLLNLYSEFCGWCQYFIFSSNCYETLVNIFVNKYFEVLWWNINYKNIITSFTLSSLGCWTCRCSVWILSCQCSHNLEMCLFSILMTFFAEAQFSCKDLSQIKFFKINCFPALISINYYKILS